MEQNENEISLSIHKIYNSDGKNKNEWQEFLFEININKKKINKQIISRLDQSFKDKTKVDLTSDFIDFIIDYGCDTVIDLISNEKFLANFISLIKKSSNSTIETQKKVIFLIQKWALKFGNENNHSIFKSNYDYLKSLNIAFPNRNYIIDTYNKYISEKEIQETMVLIKEIIHQRNQYKNAVKNFYNSIQFENPFLEKQKEKVIENVRNFPCIKNDKTPGQTDNIDNNIGRNSSLYISKLIVQENIDNNIGKNSIIFKETETDNGLKNIDNNTIIFSKNEESKSIQSNITNKGIDDDIDENNKNEIYCNKESVKINNIIKKNDDDSINKKKEINSTDISSLYLIKDKINQENMTKNNRSIKENNSNNDDSSNINININKINSSENNNDIKDFKFNDTKNNINDSIISEKNYENCNNQINRNSFDSNAFLKKLAKNITRVNNMISPYNIYNSNNHNLHQEIIDLIKKISLCDDLINKFKSNINIVNGLEKIKMDLIQTCARYECLISNKNIPEFKSSFSGNNNKYFFNKELIINYNNNNMNNNN